MNPSRDTHRGARDLLVVDLHGLKPVLSARAQTLQVTLSSLVRAVLATAVAEGPASAVPDLTPSGPRGSQRKPARQRLSLRLDATEARQLIDAARHAGLPLGEYLVTVTQTGAAPPSALDRQAHVAALLRSNAALVTLARDLSHLAKLLRQGSVQAALAYADRLALVEGEVRAHLALAAGLLAEPWLHRKHIVRRNDHA